MSAGYLLDTMTVLWMAVSPQRLSPKARAVLLDEKAAIRFTIVNLWEIGIKMSVGGYPDFQVPRDWERAIPDGLRSQGFEMLAVEPTDCRRIETLPFHHRDPFDRMIVAQALARDLQVLGTDERFDAYGVDRIW